MVNLEDVATAANRPPLYGSQQSLFARYLERREARRPDPGGIDLRRRLLASLRGRVIDVGAGDGRSFEHYQARVTGVLAVEPDPNARAKAAERAEGAAVPIEIVEGVAEALPVEDESFDAAVVMGLLCSVPDPSAALGELRRVLKPGGELRFWEHVRAEHVVFRRVQYACDALFWTRALGGCQTTRDTEAAIRDAGFRFAALDHGFHSTSLLTITSAPYILGVAVSDGR